MHKLLLTIVLGTIAFSAIGKASPLVSTNLSAPTGDSIFKQVFHVTEGEYDLYIISTCIIGIGEVSMGYFSLGKYAGSVTMLEQEFIFTKNGRTLKQYFSPVRRLKGTTASGHTYSFLEIPVNGVEVILTPNGSYYNFWSVNLDEIVPDMVLVYNVKGDLIIYNYQADLRTVEVDGLLESTADYTFMLSEDGYERYNELVHSAIKTEAHFNELVFTNYYPPYNKEYKK